MNQATLAAFPAGTVLDRTISNEWSETFVGGPQVDPWAANARSEAGWPSSPFMVSDAQQTHHRVHVVRKIDWTTHSFVIRAWFWLRVAGTYRHHHRSELQRGRGQSPVLVGVVLSPATGRARSPREGRSLKPGAPLWVAGLPLAGACLLGTLRNQKATLRGKGSFQRVDLRQKEPWIGAPSFRRRVFAL